MSQILSTAAAGLQAQQKNIDTIANNIANVNTSGYKRDRVTFADAMYQAIENPALGSESSPVSLQIGYGTRTFDSQLIDECGPLQATGRGLDLALNGAGFFQVETDDGTRTFTRNGNFASQQIDGRYFLVNSQGQFVLDQSGARIVADTSLESASISRNGLIRLGSTAVAAIGKFNFANPAELSGDGELGYTATAASGPAQAADGEVVQGSLEGSNVNLADEMTRLMTAQRVYSLLGRAITTADEMRSTENDIRR